MAFVGLAAIAIPRNSGDQVRAEAQLPSASASGGGSTLLRVIAPDSAEQVAIQTLPNVRAIPGADHGFAGIRLLAAPAHLSAAHPWSGTAQVTFSYDDAPLPKAPPGTTDAQVYGTGSLVVLRRADGSDSWRSVPAKLDTNAHTITASTNQFSDWAVGIIDPAVLATQLEKSRREPTNIDKAIEALYGASEKLTCSPDSELLSVRISTASPNAPLDACQEVLKDGSHRLSILNRAGLPRRLIVPEGFQVEQEPGSLHLAGTPAGTFTSTDAESITTALLARLLYDPGTTAIGPGRQSALTFPAERIGASTTLQLKQDDLYAGLHLLGNVLKLSAGEIDSDQVQQLALALKNVDCLGKTSTAAVRTGLPALVQFFDTCVRDILGVLLEIVEPQLKHSLKGVTTRLRMIVDLPGWLELASQELNLYTQVLGPGSNTYLDVSAQIRPARVMTTTEAFALPIVPKLMDAPPQPPGPTPADLMLDDRDTCVVPSLEDPAPAGAPQALAPRYDSPAALRKITCLRSMPIDLDGNGRLDRILTWRAGGPAGYPGEAQPRNQEELQRAEAVRLGLGLGPFPRDPTGAPDTLGPFFGMVAYLDDGSVRQLVKQDAVATWVESGDYGVNVYYLRPLRAVPGPAGKQLAVVGFVTGANTTVGVLVGLSADKALRVVKTDENVVTLRGGGGAFWGTWGCVNVADKSVAQRVPPAPLLLQEDGTLNTKTYDVDRYLTLLRVSTLPQFEGSSDPGKLIATVLGERKVSLKAVAPDKLQSAIKPWAYGTGEGCQGKPGFVEGRISPAR